MFDALLNLIPPATSTPLALAAMGGAVLIVGIAKSGFGGGIGILAVPLIATGFDPAVAIGVMLPILIVADIFAVWQHRGHYSAFHLRWSLIGCAVGIVLGTLLLWRFREADVLTTALNLGVGGVCVVMVLLQVYRMVGGKVPRIPETTSAGVGVGGLAGFISTLAHAAGPIMTIYLLDQKLTKRVLVGTLVLYFIAGNTMKLPTYIWLGFITPQTLLASAWLALLVPVGSLLGLWMHKRIAERPFTLIMYAGAAAAGLRMVWKALA